MSQLISRRIFLSGVSTATVALTVLSGCKEDKKLVCNDAEALSGLDEAQKNARKAAEYTDDSKIAAKTCDNCLHFEAPAGADKCGGCKVLQGPVHPKGYCNLWAEKG